MSAKFARSELLLRVNSALVLALISICLTYAGAQTFAFLIVFFATLMSWEWARVVRGRGIDGIFMLQVLAIVAAAYFILQKRPASGVAVIMAATLISFWIHKMLALKSDAWWSAAGIYYVGFPTLALIAIRQDPDYGFLAILYIFLIVWTTDTGAFFAGRTFKGPRLAPGISPNKTWSGLIGGAILAFVAGVAFALWLEHTSAFILGLQSVALALIAQGGDLGESAIKRFFGIKHSSGLIPGHGGVLDRLDGLVFAAIGAGLISIATDPSKPGRGLLIW